MCPHIQRLWQYSYKKQKKIFIYRLHQLQWNYLKFHSFGRIRSQHLVQKAVYLRPWWRYAWVCAPFGTKIRIFSWQNVWSPSFGSVWQQNLFSREISQEISSSSKHHIKLLLSKDLWSTTLISWKYCNFIICKGVQVPGRLARAYTLIKTLQDDYNLFYILEYRENWSSQRSKVFVRKPKIKTFVPSMLKPYYFTFRSCNQIKGMERNSDIRWFYSTRTFLWNWGELLNFLKHIRLTGTVAFGNFHCVLCTSKEFCF